MQYYEYMDLVPAACCRMLCDLRGNIPVPNSQGADWPRAADVYGMR